MKCDIIIPVWNQLQFTKRCVESVQKNTKGDYRLILIDNNSRDETRDYLRALSDENDNSTLITNRENLGFIKATNQGLRLSDAPYLCLLNNDTVAAEGWLETMISVAESDPNIGLVNPKSESPDRLSLRDYAKELAKNGTRYLETSQCMGFCMLIKREVIEKIGYLDEVFGVGGFDDTDFSKRAHLAGYKSVCAKGAYVYHDWHTSFKKAGNREEIVRKNEEIFFDKWGRYLRIGYPIIYGNNFYVDINTSLGLAREWNWVHTWLNASGRQRKALRELRLPEHQGLRLFHMSGVKAIFYLEVLFRLIERRLKRKKAFDVVLISDKRLWKFLILFNQFFSVPVFYIGPEAFSHNNGRRDDEGSWRKRARYIVNSIKKGVYA